MTSATHHYPSELFELLVETIPCLFKGKKSVITFFWGAGVDRSTTSDMERRLRADRASISKYEIVRTVLLRLNESGDASLRERREIVKRVCEFEDFSTCWPQDQHKARGLVAQVRSLVDKHDFFRRMQRQRQEEARLYRHSQRNETEKLQQQIQELQDIRQDLYGLFNMDDAQARGKQLERVLNRLFKASGISVRESFEVTKGPNGTVHEQIDGAIEFNNHIYLVEMKWLKGPVDITDVGRHVNRIMTRTNCRGLFISYSGYTEPAIDMCREAMRDAPVMLSTVKELVFLLEQGSDVKDFLSQKERALIIDKQPFIEIDGLPAV